MTDCSTSNKSHSQWGDDLLVLEYFSGRQDCVFLEAGANDPIALSQTYLLEKNGWSGVLVEPLPVCCKRLREVRTGSQIFQNALGAPDDRGILRLVIPQGATELAREIKEGQDSKGDEVVEAEFITLNEVLNSAGIEQLTYLSLDLEGMEDRALQGLDFKRYKPELIIVEDRLDHLRTHRLLKRKGYKLVRRNGSNNWYLPVGTAFQVTFITRLRLIRKLYLSMPFRWLREMIRSLKA